MGLKEAFLNKGWAGTTMSRAETTERINPLIRQHAELNHAYAFATSHVSDREAAAQLEALQKTARADVGKLRETVYSAGGVAYTGVEQEPGDYTLGSGGEDEAEMIRQLNEKEEQFQQLLTDELKENHQIRTRAILSVVQANSLARLESVRGLTKKHRRSS